MRYKPAGETSAGWFGYLTRAEKWVFPHPLGPGGGKSCSLSASLPETDETVLPSLWASVLLLGGEVRAVAGPRQGCALSFPSVLGDRRPARSPTTQGPGRGEQPQARWAVKADKCRALTCEQTFPVALLQPGNLAAVTRSLGPNRVGPRARHVHLGMGSRCPGGTGTLCRGSVASAGFTAPSPRRLLSLLLTDTAFHTLRRPCPHSSPRELPAGGSRKPVLAGCSPGGSRQQAVQL